MLASRGSARPAQDEPWSKLEFGLDHPNALCACVCVSRGEADVAEETNPLTV